MIRRAGINVRAVSAKKRFQHGVTQRPVSGRTAMNENSEARYSPWL
jgi:hypothetical protein